MAVSCRKKDMRPAHTESPLRRSDIGIYPQNVNVTINDDEAERREARRRTMQRSIGTGSDSTTEYIEDNETVKKCLEIYQGNKLSRENAWSLSLIDTLSTLLDRHHKSLKNFKVAGSSLEASSKVYSLRVDSVHTDVLRMMAGLNAQKFNEDQQENDVDDDDNDTVATGGEGSNDPVASAAAPENVASEKNVTKKSKPKRLRCTLTKNKETLNARLDTVPLQDPVFGKLNATVGSINSSNRLMNNILRTNQSILKLRTTFPFWNNAPTPTYDYTEESNITADDNVQCAPSDRLVKIINNLDNLKLRPLEGGYRITDTPALVNDDKQQTNMECDENIEPTETVDADADFANVHGMSMAFDMNAECEPVPPSCQLAPILDVNYAELEDLTMEDRIAINNCRGLRRNPIIVEDLRPVDSTSNLEYSYRPMDKISQFWAGPSHWKFKRTRTRPSNLLLDQKNTEVISRVSNQKGKRSRQAMEKKKPKELNFREFHDDRFITLDKFKHRKVNIQKKWDQKKLKLPVDLQLSPDLFQYFTLAPGLLLDQSQTSACGTLQICNEGDDFNAHNSMIHGSGLEALQQDHFMHDNNASDDNCSGDMNISGGNNMNDRVPALDDLQTDNNVADSTVLEIATNFEGAPSQVTKIIVPFAKRAKVIDMKSLKRSCFILLNKQFKRPLEEAQIIPMHPIKQNENFIDGLATFSEIYEHLPKLLTQNMSESLSPSIALYSVLHLANEHNLRLIPQQNLEDFIIRKLA